MRVVLLIGILCSISEINCNVIGSQSTTYVPGIGSIIVRKKIADKGTEYEEFKDIPYAYVQPDQLFEPPIPAYEQKEGAVNEGILPVCPGWEYEHYEDISNCLVVTIHTKNRSGNSPVLVYFSGLSPTPGQSPKVYSRMLMEKDIVTVTAEYRVGPYGFLSTLTNEIRGNIAMLDAIEALRWIQKHIKHFGGDPKRVTLMGQHLAAGVIGVLSTIQSTKGLFHRIIYQNGSPLMEGFQTSDPLKIARAVGHKAECDDEENDALTKCLLKVHPDILIEAYKSVWQENEGKMYPFTTDFDPIFARSIKKRSYPMIGGFVEYPTVHLLEEYFARNISRFSRENLEEVFQNELEQFRENNRSEEINEDEFLEIKTKEMLNKTAFHIKDSVVRSLQENAANGGKSYAYVFKYKGGWQRYQPKDDSILRNYVDMVDDYMYLSVQYSSTKRDRKIMKLMVDLWTSFAATGIPESEYIEWPQISSLTGPYLVFDSDPYIFNGTVY